jgi:hypothetical protein
MHTFAALAALLALGAVSAVPAVAQPERCSSESFPVGGQTVAVTVCAGAPSGRDVVVNETFSHHGQSFGRSVKIEVLNGADVSRAVDDASLTPFGLPYTLHLTLAYRAGSAVIEHALLLPGAVPLK